MSQRLTYAELAADRCRMACSTHSAGGVSLNDPACAAKIEALSRP